MVIIESKSNKLIKEVKSLDRKKNRDKLCLYVAEGLNMVEEIIDKDYEYEYILYSKKLMEIQGGMDFFEKIAYKENIYRVEEEVFDSISDTLNPQGVLAVCTKKEYSLDKIMANGGTYIYLDSLQDPGNMGTIIRSGDAFGIGGIILNKGTVDPFNKKVIRATMGSIFRLPIFYVDDQIKEITNFKEIGFKILATSLESSNNIGKVEFENSIVIIGNEAKGVSEEIFKLADELIKIEMVGDSESLNAGVAASIIMYESSK